MVSLRKRTILHYVIIYILICYQGAPLFVVMGSDRFYGGVLVFCGLYFYGKKRLNSYKLFIMVLFVLMIFTMAISGGGLTLGSCLSLITRFLIVIVAIDYNPALFLRRFFNLVVFICVINLVLFFINTVFGWGVLTPLYKSFYKLSLDNGTYNTYGLLFTRLRIGYPRNSGMFGEPGQFAALLLPALYLLIFRTREMFTKKQYICYLVILVISVLTCQSTAGYIALLGVLLALVCTKTHYGNTTKTLFCSIAILLLIYLTVYAGENNFFQRIVIDKLFNSNGGFDMSVSSGSARISAFELLYEYYPQHPEIVLGIGTAKGYGIDATMCSGMLNVLIMYGLPAFLLLHGYLFGNCLKYADNIWDFTCRVYILLGICLSQPNILFASLVLLMLYDQILYKTL